jgi:hypothetical protein
MQHLDGSGAWPSYIQDAGFLKVSVVSDDVRRLYLNHIFVGTHVTANATEIVTHENDETCRNTRNGNTHDSGNKTLKTATTKVGIKGVDGSVNRTNTVFTVDTPITHQSPHNLSVYVAK